MRDFTGDIYQTNVSETNKRGFKFLRRSRLVFILKLLGTVKRSRRLALNRNYHREEWSDSSREILHLLEDSGAVFTIKGFDNFRNLENPIVFISNHMSTLETLVMPCLVAPSMDVTFVVKESLVSYPVFGPIMRSRDPIVVSRNNSRNDLMVVLKEGQKKLAEGSSVIIFPQSTRRDSLQISEFNSLGVKLAERAGVQVVPMAIKTDYWKNGKRIKDLGPFDRNQPVNIEFGEPMDVERGGKETHAKIVAFISKHLKEWGVGVVE